MIVQAKILSRLKAETGIQPREALLVSKFIGPLIISLGKIHSVMGNKPKASSEKSQEQQAGTHFCLVLNLHSSPSPYHQGTLQFSYLH